MSDAEGGGAVRDKRKQLLNFTRSWFNDYPKRKFDERRAEREKENATERAERRTANATWFIAILTLVIALVGFFQWWVLSGTLDEMRAEQRPAIWIGDNWGGPEYLKQLDQVIWDVPFANRGKGLVRDGTYRSFIKVGSGDYVRSFGQPEQGSLIPPLAAGQHIFTTIVGRPHQTDRPIKIAVSAARIKLRIVVRYRSRQAGGGLGQS